MTAGWQSDIGKAMIAVASLWKVREERRRAEMYRDKCQRMKLHHYEGCYWRPDCEDGKEEAEQEKEKVDEESVDGEAEETHVPSHSSSG